MKSHFLILLISLFLITGCNDSFPIYKLEESVSITVIDSTEIALSKLSYNGKTYVSEPEQHISPDYYSELEIGKQIGKTEDGLQVHEVKNDDKRVVIKGFMYPAYFYKLVTAGN